MSQYSNLTAALRAALAVWRAAPIAARAASVLALASCSGVVGAVPPTADGQAPSNMSPVDGSPSPDAGAPESSGGGSSGSGQPDVGAPEDAATSDTGDASPEDGGYDTEGNAPDSPPFPAACSPMPNTDTLPFAVDDVYATSGYEGDAVNAGAITLEGDSTCGGNRSGQSPLGACHTVLYTPLIQGQAIGAMTALGWAGVAWQYPADNWGTGPGYAIPPAAKTVTFSARGAAGGEVVSFWIGGTGVGTAATGVLCSDPLSVHIDVTLTSRWTVHTIPLSGPYAPAVLTGFGFTVARSEQPAALQAQAITFYVDDIRWQM
jgi:hypothetical protein